MITILHGDHTQASRTELLGIISSAKDKEIRRLDGKTLDAGLFTQATESSSMFGGKPLIVIERLFAVKNKKSKEFGAVVSLLKKSLDVADIVLWEDKELEPATLKALGNIQNRVFKIPSMLFQFLDALKPENANQLLSMYQVLSDSAAPELVFTMVVRRLRQLMSIASGVKPAGLADWQEVRLTKQASLFTMDKLTAMHKLLLDAEFSLKSGTSPFQLSEHMEQFLILL
mgnify:CR=1 FL=1